MTAGHRVFSCLLALLACACVPTFAATAPPPPRDLQQKVGFDQRLGAQLPMSSRFTDRHGREASLAEWMDGRPTVLAMGYFHCPNLCDAVMQGMAHAVDVPGDLDVLPVSSGSWAVFRASGPYPATLQDLWAATATEWFPSNPWRLRPGPEVVAVLDRADDLSTATVELWLPVEAG